MFRYGKENGWVTESERGGEKKGRVSARLMGNAKKGREMGGIWHLSVGSGISSEQHWASADHRHSERGGWE